MKYIYFRELEELLNRDYGFVEVIVGFDDLEKLDSLLSSIPDNLNRDMAAYWIFEQYLYYQILKHLIIPSDVGFDDNQIKKMKEGLFGGDFERFINLQFVDLSDFDQIVSILNKELKSRLGVHFMLDRVEDTTLQMAINSIVASRLSMVIMGYTSRQALPTYQLNSGGKLEKTAECFAYNEGEIQKMLEFSSNQK